MSPSLTFEGKTKPVIVWASRLMFFGGFFIFLVHAVPTALHETGTYQNMMYSSSGGARDFFLSLFAPVLAFLHTQGMVIFLTALGGFGLFVTGVGSRLSLAFPALHDFFHFIGTNFDQHQNRFIMGVLILIFVIFCFEWHRHSDSDIWGFLTTMIAVPIGSRALDTFLEKHTHAHGLPGLTKEQARKLISLIERTDEPRSSVTRSAQGNIKKKTPQSNKRGKPK